MHILITNDGGYAASGINTLSEELAKAADVSVAAPDRKHSGACNSLSPEQGVAAVAILPPWRDLS